MIDEKWMLDDRAHFSSSKQTARRHRHAGTPAPSTFPIKSESHCSCVGQAGPRN